MPLPSNRFILFVLVFLAAAATSGWARAAARVDVGPTPIVDGEAAAAGDITVSNEKLAFGLAVESVVPYGVPRGAIIDIAPVVDGKPGRDRVVFADFIPNNWSAWANTYQKVDILERGPDAAVVRATRDWGKVTIATTYTLRANSDRIEMRTTMTNTGTTAIPGLLSGVTLWPSAGYFFEIPGIAGLQEGKATAALADRTVAYDEDWFIALHAPYMDHVGSTSKDLWLQHSLQAGEARMFDAWLQVGARGDLAPVLTAEIARKQLPAGTLRGAVASRDGKPVADPVIVVEKGGTPYAWTLGHDGKYEMQLPAGDYSVYATAKGYSQSGRAPLQLGAGATTVDDFRALEPPGKVRFVVVDARTAQGVDARIHITEGQRPVVEYLGRSTFFTELDPKGQVEVAMAPGRYQVAVSSGGGFLARDEIAQLDVHPGQLTTLKSSITPLFDPPAAGWYAADLHHHADQAEGVTPPEYVARSQLAAGLDLLFVSDHDSTVNHAPLQKIADRRGVPFIPSVELSPSWGHFNAWPLQPGMKLAIDTSTATIDQVLGEARRQGAMVVGSNHPFIPYGYLASLEAGVVPGGFNPGFDLLEMNSDDATFDARLMRTLWKFWNAGHRYYLSAGADVHDVWNHQSGSIRTYGHIEGAPTPRSYAEAVKSGHAYVTYGPLIFPAVMFGSELRVKSGATFTLSFALKSVAGLQQATLVGAGSVAGTKAFDGAPREANAEFQLSAKRSMWYAIEVEDRAGHKAYSNPIWIDVVDFPVGDGKP